MLFKYKSPWQIQPFYDIMALFRLFILKNGLRKAFTFRSYPQNTEEIK